MIYTVFDGHCRPDSTVTSINDVSVVDKDIYSHKANKSRVSSILLGNRGTTDTVLLLVWYILNHLFEHGRNFLLGAG